MKCIKTEQEMRDSKVPWLNTIEELTEYIESLVNKNHDYGTCVYAMSMASIATFRYISSKLGVSGFQASCADLDFISRTRGYKLGFMLINYEDLLYPQYKHRVPTWDSLTIKHAEKLAEAAKKQLDGQLHPDVRARFLEIIEIANETH